MDGPATLRPCEFATVEFATVDVAVVAFRCLTEFVKIVLFKNDRDCAFTNDLSDFLHKL